MGTNFCTRCGSQTDPNAKSCASCGAPLSSTSGAIAAQGTLADEARRRAVGFFGKLLDFGFNQFLSVTIIRVLYIIAVVAISLEMLVEFVAALQGGPFGGLLGGYYGPGGAVQRVFTAFFLVPLLGFVQLIAARVSCEVMIAVVKIAENTSVMSSRLESRANSNP